MTVLVERRRSSPTALAIVAGTLVVAAAVGACGSSDARSEFAADDAWARPTPTGATNGVVYLSLSTDIADSLVRAEVAADVAGAAELHATVMGDGGGGSHSHGGGGGGETISMGEVEGFDLSPASPLVFEPGGNHIMLVDVPAPLELGRQFVLTLEFASERSLDVTVTVADNPPD